MYDKDVVESVRSKLAAPGPVMGERLRRQWAGAEAEAAGWGGIRLVAEATGLSPHTICSGVRELRRRAGGAAEAMPPGRVRRPGGGRKPLAETDPTLAGDLDAQFRIKRDAFPGEWNDTISPSNVVPKSASCFGRTLRGW